MGTRMVKKFANDEGGTVILGVSFGTCLEMWEGREVRGGSEVPTEVGGRNALDPDRADFLFLVSFPLVHRAFF